MSVDIDALLADGPCATVAAPNGFRERLLKLGFGAYGETYKDKPGFRQGIAESIQRARVLPEKLHYETSDGAQVAWYVPPQSGQHPEFVWLAFNGTGQLALAWMDVLRDGCFPSTAFVLVDYPGYGGWCRGSLSCESIQRNALGAAEAVQRRLAVSIGDFERNSGVLGYSVGCAAALQYAAARRVSKGVLIAPFVALRAAGLLGWLPAPIAGGLAAFLQADFDNASSLAASRRLSPAVTYRIYHGKLDDVCPWIGSRTLSEQFEDFVTLDTDEAVGHDIYDKRRSQILDMIGVGAPHG